MLDLAHAKQGQGGALVDWDGDGRDDKLVGAPWATFGNDVGVVLIYPGTTSGFSTMPSAQLNGDDNLGFSILRLGDVDGDGKAEVAVSALTGDSSDTHLCGSVTIYKGGSNGQVIAKVGAGQPGAKFGYALAHGDLNADGVDDLVVGAPYQSPDPSLYQQGAVHVFFGPTFATSTPILATSTAKGLGWAVGAGDLDSDGTSDLLLSLSGKVLGFRGGAGFAPVVGAPDLSVAFTATTFGRSLAVTNEYILIGAPKAKVGVDRDAGSLYVLSKAALPRALDLASAPANLIVTLNGAALFSRFATGLAAVGDLDADGHGDFIVGAAGDDVDANDMRGRAYLFLGSSIGATTTIANATTFSGTGRFQQYGTLLAPGASNRLLVGAPGDAGDVGRAFVLDLATRQPVAGGESGGLSGMGQ